MLTSIELSGFKSFADKTRMDFSEGISVLVGPNGSGKSNIVDAIKWVLGEQSVKKLRGQEMTDVIFGGSESRPPANFAEVTLSFDNRLRFFPIETDDVHLTRRLYRSGESEYLINRQASRLKDVRDLLSGSGLGSQAYSIIEQGRVGLLLQSTSLSRRAILEEAAGTARFSAKQQEALRRLERVEQNLLRLSDIVGEVENQLRQTKAQAGKAQQYRQLSAKLQQLQTEASLFQWRRKRERAVQITSEIENESQERTILEGLVSRNQELREKEGERLEAIDQEIRIREKERSAVRERMAGEDSTVEFQFEQIRQLEKEITELQKQFSTLNIRSGDAEEMTRKTQEEIREAQKRHQEVTEFFHFHQKELEKWTEQEKEFQRQLTEQNEILKEHELSRTRISVKIEALESRKTNIQKNTEQTQNRFSELKKQIQELLDKDGKLKGDAENLSQQIRESEKRIEEIRDEKEGLESDLTLGRQKLQEDRQRFTGTKERISLLEDLLRKREGLSPGVKEVLTKAADPASPFRHVRGLVADLIRVSPEGAPLIELALGQTAQYLVVAPDKELFASIENSLDEFTGRAGFIWLYPPPENDDRWRQKGEFDGIPGVLGRADRFVETDVPFAYLVYRLLGKTWIVENLQVAKKLYRHSDGRTDFITLTGESILSNGTLIVGPPHTPSGLITRRTELRTLLAARDELEKTITKKAEKIKLLSKNFSELSQRESQEAKELKGLQDSLDKLKIQQVTIRDRDQRTQSEYKRLEGQINELTKDWNDAHDLWNTAVGEQKELEIKIAETESTVNQIQSRHDQSESARQEELRQTTNLKIELAKCEERLGSLTDRKKQFEDNFKERQKHLSEHAKRLESLQKRRDNAEILILRAESVLASAYLQKEEVSQEQKRLSKERIKIAEAVRKAETEWNQGREALAKIQESIHFKEMEEERIDQDLHALADRMREDYGIDLSAESAQTQNSGSSNNSSAQETSVGSFKDCLKEINNLKGKIQRLGSVNLEAIESLERLETRFTMSSNQYNDLISAKKGVLKTIEKTNLYRQRLFEETFEAVKIYFCDIFQQLFGGGHADVVFEDPENPMESGIDIIVRPPGKDLKNVALLSGGEKTLTCVAFLLAIFRYRSSPICILDEVDAALDEGNVDRFNAMIRDFKSDTQFFMITHSKKTMTIAKNLYGVTMQDSGVSKLIAVQFDDVGEDGEILIKADSSSEDAQRGTDSGNSAENAA